MRRRTALRLASLTMLTAALGGCTPPPPFLELELESDVVAVGESLRVRLADGLVEGHFCALGGMLSRRMRSKVSGVMRCNLPTRTVEIAHVGSTSGR
jgi:hypothetical protein